MTTFKRVNVSLALALLLSLIVAGCHEERTVSYSQDVKPILEKYCTECHLPGGEGYKASGFSMESYTDLMKGTRNGPMIIAGDPLGSNMLVLMAGRADPSINMPHGKAVGADKQELETIRLWIEQGARNN